MRIEIAPEPEYRLFVPEGSIRDSVLGLPCPAGSELLYVGDTVYCIEVGTAETRPIRQGPSVSFHPNGALKEQGLYQDDERTGVWVGWDDSGQKSNVVCYREGAFHGLYITFWPNGVRQTEIQFSDGKKHGTSKSWTDDGAPLTFKRFEHGHPVESWALRADGSAVKL
jgi:hypothetical protein